MIDAYRDAGGRGELHLQVHLSWAPDQREAEAIAHDQWRSNVFPPPVCWDIDLAETFDAVCEDVPLEQVRQVVQRLVRPRRAHRAARRVRRAGLRRDRPAPRRAGAGGVRRRVRREGPPPAALDLRGDRRMRLTRTSDLWWKNAVVYCLDVETYADGNGDGCGDFRGLIQQHRPPGPARRHLPVADAVLPVPGPRRRLRHHRLLRRRPAAGHARRLRRAGAHRPRPRHAGDRRPRGQPHLGPAPVVRRGAQQPRLPQARLVRLGGRAARRRGRRAWCSPTRRPASGSYDEQTGQYYLHQFYKHQPDLNVANPRGPRRDRPDHGLLDGAGPVRVPGGRGAVPHRDQAPAGQARPSRPARLPGRPGRVPAPAQRGGGAARRGQPALPGPDAVLRGPRRRRQHRRADHVLRLHRHAGDVPVAGPRRRRAAGRRAASSGPSRPRTGTGPRSCATTTS